MILKSPIFSDVFNNSDLEINSFFVKISVLVIFECEYFYEEIAKNNLYKFVFFIILKSSFFWHIITFFIKI